MIGEQGDSFSRGQVTALRTWCLYDRGLKQKQTGFSFLSLKLMCLSWGRRQWWPTPVLLPGKSHGRRSLVGCSPWGHWESATTERLHFHFSLSCIGEGNGNPLWCSCLENPRDGGAWWAAVYGVAQSRTWLKWLSSSSSSLSGRLRTFLDTLWHLICLCLYSVATQSVVNESTYQHYLRAWQRPAAFGSMQVLWVIPGTFQFEKCGPARPNAWWV